MEVTVHLVAELFEIYKLVDGLRKMNSYDALVVLGSVRK